MIPVIQLDHVLHLLHVLAHLQSPSLWILFFRFISQLQFAGPLISNKKRTLRFWFSIAVLVNIGPIIKHTFTDASTTSSMLDFIGYSVSSIVSKSR